MGKYAKDEELLEQLKIGDDKFLKEIYMDMRSEFMLFIARYFGVSAEKATEIYPEVFSKFYFNIKDGKLSSPLKSTLKTYLFAIGKNIFMKHYQSAYHKKVTLDDSIFGTIPDDTKLNYYEYKDTYTIVRNILNTLGSKCKELLTLAYIEEKSTAEIGNILGVENPGTLRKRKFDCLQLIRKKFPNTLNALK